MSKRIFKAMMAVTLTTLLVCMALFIAILFPYFETQLSDELRNELEYLAPNVERDGLGYLERLGDHAVNVAEWVEFLKTGVHKSRKIV